MRGRDERGAIIPLVAISLVLLIAIAAFTVDLGRQRVARRDMQAIADVVALDMARQLDGRTQAVIKATSRWRGGLEASVRDNLNTGGTPAISTQQQQEDAIATIAGSPLVVKATMGYVDPRTGVFTSPIPYPDIPNAVRVTASTSVDFGFAPGSGSATRSAVGSAVSNECFSIGSFTVGLGRNPSILVSLLNPIMGDTTLTAVSYQGLAAASVSLLDLIRAPSINVGAVGDLLAAGDITVGDIALASAYALRKQGGATNIAQAVLLERLADSSVVSSIAVNVGRVLGLSTAGEGVLDASFNVLDLLAGAATVANGTHFVGVPPMNLSVPNLASTTQSLSITEDAHIACGTSGATAKTAQIQANASGTVGTSVPVPLGGTVTIGGPLLLGASVGQATGTLGTVSCGPDVIPVKVLTALTTMSQGLLLTIGGNDIGISNSVVGLPGLVTADINLTQSVASSLVRPADPGTTLTWTMPTDAYSSIKSTGSGDHTLSHASVATASALSISDIRVAGVPLADVKLLGVPIDPLLRNRVINTVDTVVNAMLAPGGLIANSVSGIVTGTVNPVIDSLNVAIDGLAKALGLELGGADVSVLPSARCDTPVLRG